MFVCNCHGIRERDVAAACNKGCQTVKEVFAHVVQAAPCCGRCVPEIRDFLTISRQAVAAE